jgi:hypothetical protein
MLTKLPLVMLATLAVIMMVAAYITALAQLAGVI